MLADMDNLPAEVTLAVPYAYREYLLYKKTIKHLALLLFYSLILGSYYYQWRHGKIAVGMLPHLVVLAMSALALLVAARLYKKWQYEISSATIKLVHWQWRGRIWEWRELQWRQDVVINTEPDEWRGLPALRLQVKLKHQKTPQDLWIVYAHEDQDTVQNVVLPLIEKYRKQHRHEFWADALRQEE